MIVTDIKQIQKYCTGCFACFNSCPTNAIHMIQNKEGFYYPKVEKEKCINCGKCIKCCSIDKQKEKMKIGKIYAFQGEENIRMQSSSGAIFYYLAKTILEQHGVVYGAVFDETSKCVKHISTDQVELKCLQKSKYVQSKIEETFKETKKNLEQKRHVLFTGTPCQIDGLKRYLGKEYHELLTMDFVCHGVPSPGIFKDMIDSYERKEHSKIVDITFREKDLGWRQQVTKFYFENGNVKRERSFSHYFYYLFSHNITLRKSCYFCNYPESHVSDITVLDYWKIMRDDDKGVSACIINSQKGEEFFERINDKVTYKEIVFEEIKEGFISHDKIKGYIGKLKWRKKCFSCYQKAGIDVIEKKFFPRFYQKCRKEERLIRKVVNVKKQIKKILGYV